MPVAAMRAAGLGEVRRWKLHESTRNFIPLDMQISNVLFWDLRSIASSSPGREDFASPKTKHTISACPTGWYLLYTFRCTIGARWFYLPPTRPSLHAESYCIHTTSLPTFVSTPFFCGGGDNIVSSAGGNLREYNRAVSADTWRVAMINPPLFEMGLKMLDVDLH